MALATSIGERVAALHARIDQATLQAGRQPGDVAILAVTKMQSREAIIAALDAGLSNLGENYLQEAREKFVDLPPVTKHYIGHIQTNKAKAIATLFDVVQSVDRLDAGLALAKAARGLERTLRVLIQINISPTERFGVTPDEAPQLAARLRDEGLVVDGVMAIGPQDGDIGGAFAVARATHVAVGGSLLSLGMSGDWETAIAHGSTMVRIGTAIFGPRPARERVSV